MVKKATLGTYDEFMKSLLGKAKANGNPNVTIFPGGAGVTISGNPPFTSGLGLMHKGYQQRKINGDPNDKSKVEAIQCFRCKKWIPIIALLDYEDGFKRDKVLDCQIGRTGSGGIHMFDFGDPNNPSISTTMMPLSQVEPYSPSKKTPNVEPEIKPEAQPKEPLITAENFEEEMKKLKALLDEKKNGGVK